MILNSSGFVMSSYQQDETNPMEPYYVLMASILIAWLCASLCGNITLFSVFARYRQLCSPANILLLNLGIANLGLAVSTVPLSASAHFFKQWIFRGEGCKFYGFFTMFFGLTGIGNVTLLAVSRYIIICRRELADQLAFLHYRYFAMLAWVNGLFWAVMPIFGWSRYDLEGNVLPSCAIDWMQNDGSYVSYIVSMFVINFVMPIVIMILCYLRAFVADAERPRPDGDLQETLREPTAFNVDWASQNEAHMFGVLTVIFIILQWLPYCTIFFWAISADPHTIPMRLLVIAPLTTMTSTWIMPIIILLVFKKFRCYTLMMLCCRTDVETINIPDPAEQRNVSTVSRRYADHDQQV